MSSCRATNAKVRPVLVLGTGGLPLTETLRKKSTAWQVTPTFLVVPYYGGEADHTGGEWYPGLVEQIRICSWPQYFYEKLPNSTMESILRFDHIQPISQDPSAYECLPYVLGEKALSFMDEWLMWFFTGLMQEEGDLNLVRDGLSEIARTFSSRK